jgi:hypothetical protein
LQDKYGKLKLFKAEAKKMHALQVWPQFFAAIFSIF